jgi:hypothetical protein
MVDALRDAAARSPHPAPAHPFDAGALDSVTR